MRPSLRVFALLLSGLAGLNAVAHTGHQPSVHDTVAGIVERLKKSPDARDIRRLDRERAEKLLTAEERDILGTGHVAFHVNQPVLVTVFRDQALGNDPFWLREGGWRKRSRTLKAADATFDLWEREFPAGDVGLGINSLKGGGWHYFVTLQGRGTGPVAVSDVYPGPLRVTTFQPGAGPWADRDEKLAKIPDGFAGATLIQTLHSARDDAKLVGRVRWTGHPSGILPDHVVLTWSGDPRTTQAIQWRTATATKHGVAKYIEAAAATRDPGATWSVVPAVTTVLTSVTTANDPVVHRHTVEIAGLRPGTTYAYRVGTGTEGGWSTMREFTTAPAATQPFAFVYMGDAQNGLDTWGKLVRGAYRARPDASFYLMAGDLVNRGNERDDWDDFFENARGVFDRRPIVPVLGNHECQGGHPTLYLGQFVLPKNGPTGIEAERAYAFDYGNARFVVLDSNLAPEGQAAWLEEQLAQTRARWKIVSYHHPAYSSVPSRDNKKVREVWTPIFDRQGVDLALQGHDHAYLRTHPLRANVPMAGTAEGTTYVVSVSGTKFYSQARQDTTVVGFTNVATWQVLDLQIDGDVLRYRAIDKNGRVRDEFVIDKRSALAQGARD